MTLTLCEITSDQYNIYLKWEEVGLYFNCRSTLFGSSAADFKIIFPCKDYYRKNVDLSTTYPSVFEEDCTVFFQKGKGLEFRIKSAAESLKEEINHRNNKKEILWDDFAKCVVLETLFESGNIRLD